MSNMTTQPTHPRQQRRTLNPPLTPPPSRQALNANLKPTNSISISPPSSSLPNPPKSRPLRPKLQTPPSIPGSLPITPPQTPTTTSPGVQVTATRYVSSIPRAVSPAGLGKQARVYPRVQLRFPPSPIDSAEEDEEGEGDAEVDSDGDIDTGLSDLDDSFSTLPISTPTPSPVPPPPAATTPWPPRTFSGDTTIQLPLPLPLPLSPHPQPQPHLNSKTPRHPSSSGIIGGLVFLKPLVLSVARKPEDEQHIYPGGRATGLARSRRNSSPSRPRMEVRTSNSRVEAAAARLVCAVGRQGQGMERSSSVLGGSPVERARSGSRAGAFPVTVTVMGNGNGSRMGMGRSRLSLG